MNNQEPLNWKVALDHLFSELRIYTDLLDTPGTATAPALFLVILPLLHRYIQGERSQALWDDIMATN